MMRLKDKVAIVTGGARDIGRSASIKLAREGAKVAINYFGSEQGAQETLETIKAGGGEAIIVQGDMTRSDEVAKLVSAAQAAFGQDIHVLVNIVGGLVERRTLDRLDADFINRVVQLNLNPVVLAMRAVVPSMSAGASIINMSSQAARDGGGGGSSIYAASKGAVTTFSRAMAKELGPEGIRVNAVCAGMISTTFHDTFTTDDVRKKVAGMTPLRREGHPDEIGDLIAYLASHEASFLTGMNVDANGGLVFS